MFLSSNFVSGEASEYNRFCQIVDSIISKGHANQKLIVVLESGKLTCMNSSGKTVCMLKNVDDLLALDIQFHLQIMNFEFVEYRNFPPHFKAIYECKKH